MKLKIKVKVLTEGCLPEINPEGEFIDLRAAQDVNLNCPFSNIKSETSHKKVSFSSKYIPLGIAMKLPKGFEAICVSRSSTPKKFNIILSNSVGIIDNSYSGNNDQWVFPAIAIGTSKIFKGDRICQFRIQLSQKATVWQKLKWLFSNGVKIVEVDNLDSQDRGGLGHSGVK